MEFVSPQEILGLLTEFGITEQRVGEESIHLVMADREGTVRLQLAGPSIERAADDGVQTVSMAEDQLAGAVERILQRLHLREVVLCPVGVWRMVFDAVAFGLAENEDWQAVDAAATVELNSRDPLWCDQKEYQTLIALVSALLADAEGKEQGLAIVSAASPILIEVNPEGVVGVSAGTAALADEVAEAVGA